MFFAADKRVELKKSNPDLKLGEIGKATGEAWKELTDKEKEPYNKKAEKVGVAGRASTCCLGGTLVKLSTHSWQHLQLFVGPNACTAPARPSQLLTSTARGLLPALPAGQGEVREGEGGLREDQVERCAPLQTSWSGQPARRRSRGPL